MTETLSSKINLNITLPFDYNPDCILVEDVKQFIKKDVFEVIREKCMGTSANCYEIIKEIKKRAGEGLCSEKEVQE